ncbi:hypothetical protein F2Q65_00520 [Thiohalocapsa marina]|uniref:Uncharacterized protein n=1 Tax=Thiohalocapsa marina TaxID=424902 RepID=A0A5M8FVH2_9GAMM|nr:hypothetical protein [Thiohalocapsa marina]KAA6187763.1 hypothetical protein F2Q65_00520 [Thiohalocapsa marina]
MPDLAKLKRLLEAGRASARGKDAEILAQLQGTALQQDYAKVSRAIARLRYADARCRLQDFVQRL